MSSTTCFQGESLEFPFKTAQRGLRIFGGDFKVYEIEDKRDYTSEPHSDWINVALHLRTAIQVERGSCMISGCTSKIPFKLRASVVRSCDSKRYNCVEPPSRI